MLVPHRETIAELEVVAAVWDGIVRLALHLGHDAHHNTSEVTPLDAWLEART